MKKFTILSPLVLLATTALAQDSTCILQPSCSQLGYTSAEADCGSQKVLCCPFDVSQVACVGGSSNSGGGASDSPTTLLKLDKSGITKMNNVCGASTNGVVPPLPSTLKDASKMFYDCTNINSPYPKLPDGLEIADYMFSSSTSMTTDNSNMMKFSGSVELPSSLESVSYMFKNNVKLNQVIGLENLQITNARGMFYWAKGLTSTPILPSILTDGTEMFYGAGLTELPSLPSGIIYANKMFGTHFNLGVRMKGTLPNLPDSIVEAESMFEAQEEITGTLTKLPANLTMARYMFKWCPGITGSPAKPAGLTSYTYDICTSSGLTLSWATCPD